MTLTKALKLKNKLTKDLNELIRKLHNNNSIIEGGTRYYSTKNILGEIYQKVDELNIIKTKITRANTPVQDKIFLLSELKSLVLSLKSLDCTNGVVNGLYSGNKDTNLVKNSEISVLERDDEVKFLESRIDELQNELDDFNGSTLIEE